MIEQLATPVERDLPGGFGKVTLTHKAWGMTHQPYNKPELLSYSVLGRVDENGDFQAWAGTEEYAQITGDDYKELRAGTPDGKKQDQFRTDDVIVKHKAIHARALTKAP